MQGRETGRGLLEEAQDAERTARLFERGTSWIVAVVVALGVGMIVLQVLR